MTILYFIAGIIIASLVAYFLHRSIIKNQSDAFKEKEEQNRITINNLQQQSRQLQQEKEELITKATKAAFFEEALNARNISFERLQEEHQNIQNQFAAVKENYKNSLEKLALQKEELNQIGEAFKFEFRNLAQNILEEKTHKFTVVN
jgi:DNA recombination protein RmuC